MEDSETKNSEMKNSEMEDGDESSYYYEEVKEKLQGKSKKELLELLAEAAENDWSAGRFILGRAMMNSGDMKNLVKSLLDEIRSVTSKPAWSREWSDKSYLPDYSHLYQRFAALKKRALKEQSCADALLELGDELWKLGNAQLEKSSDEGETGTAITECMEIAIRAVPKSSRSKPEQLLWAIEVESTDNYDILEEKYFDFMESDEYAEADWREVASALESRLLAMGDEWFRHNFVNWLLRAYKSGGLKDRVIPLLEREGDYVELVDVLLEEGRREEAKRKCLFGYEEFAEKGRFPPNRLHRQLLEMAEAEGQYGLAAAYYWDDFCDNPDHESYVKLRDAVEKVGCWPAVREAALRFLKTGTRPDRPAAKKTSKRKWPLPPTEVAHLSKEKSYFSRTFPMITPLIRVAILEKRADDVAKLYHALHREEVRTQITAFGINHDIARAVSDKYPDVALSIWRSLMNMLLDHVSPDVCKHVQFFLENMKPIYEKTNRLDEWTALISELKTAHKDEPDLLKSLAAVE
jgi:uncharacterized Zn finger protein